MAASADKPSMQQSDCDALSALIPAFSLGATDPDETVAVRAQLADCPEAVHELAQYAALAETLLYSAPPVQPPAAVVDRLAAAIGRPAVPDRQSPPASQARPHANRWQRLQQALSAPAWWPALGVGVAALVLLVAVSLYWSNRLSVVTAQQQQIAAALEQHAALLAMVGEGDFRRTNLATGPAGEATAAAASVVYDPSQMVGLVFAQNLPPLPAGQAYQMWLIRGEERTSGGLFVVDDDGRGVLTFKAPQPLQSYDAIGITREPSTGSAGPTTPPVVKGSL